MCTRKCKFQIINTWLHAILVDSDANNLPSLQHHRQECGSVHYARHKSCLVANNSVHVFPMYQLWITHAYIQTHTTTRFTNEIYSVCYISEIRSFSYVLPDMIMYRLMPHLCAWYNTDVYMCKGSCYLKQS